MNRRYQTHPFHLVNPSYWPLLGSMSGLTFTLGMAMYMHNYVGGGATVLAGLGLLFLTMYVWWRDVIDESFQGHHTKTVQLGLKYGMVLFIVSEVMFFFAFFWAFFHAALSPSIEIGAVWPPLGIEVLDPFAIPLINTLILLLSGVTVTTAHHAMVEGYAKESNGALITTVALAVVFTIFQGLEYEVAPFTIADSVYGTTFFLTTGLHGFHVIIGTILLAVCLIRQIKGHFTKTHHVGFECSAWYWHFVDVVWLFLYVFMYCWSGYMPS